MKKHWYIDTKYVKATTAQEAKRLSKDRPIAEASISYSYDEDEEPEETTEV